MPDRAVLAGGPQMLILNKAPLVQCAVGKSYINSYACVNTLEEGVHGRSGFGRRRWHADSAVVEKVRGR